MDLYYFSININDLINNINQILMNTLKYDIIKIYKTK